MEAYGQELLCAFACKNTAKITAPHVLALRQIAWLNQTGSQSTAFQLITVSSGLVRELTTCYISIAQRKLMRDSLVLSKCRNEWWRMRFGGFGRGARVQAHLSFWRGTPLRPVYLPSQRENRSWYTHCWKRHNKSHPSLSTWLVKSKVMETLHTCIVQNTAEGEKRLIRRLPKDVIYFVSSKKRTSLTRKSAF